MHRNVLSLAGLLVLAVAADAVGQAPNYPPYPTTRAPNYPPPSDSGATNRAYPFPGAAAGPVLAAPYRNAERLPPVDGLPPLVEQPSAPAAAPAEAPAEAPQYQRFWNQPTTWLGPIWEANFEIGINGATGNAQSFSLSSGAKFKRTTDEHSLGLEIIQNLTTTRSITTQNNAIGQIKYERLFPDSPWSFFTHGYGEYDQFKAFDLRLVGNAGVGYKFIDREGLELKGRLGSGVSHEIGGPDDSYVPEAVFGMDYKHQFTKRQKFVATVDYFPEWGDFMEFRLVADASWEILLDEATDMNLKIGVLDRYDSTPNGRKPNDLTYTLLLLWKL